MEEANAKKTKTKTVSLKNKKTAKASLAKASIKGKTTTTKKTAKAPTIKKKPELKTNIEKDVLVNKEELQEKKINNTTKNVVKKTTKKEEPKNLVKEYKKKKSTIKEPNNIIRKIPKEEKTIGYDTTVEPLSLDEEKAPQRIDISLKDQRKEEKKQKRLEKRRLKAEKKALRKNEKLKLKEKKLQEKKELKEKEKKDKEKRKNKSKIEFPKEWKTINSKNDRVVKEEKPKTFKGKIKSSIFELVDEKVLEERKKQSKESIKKSIIVFLIIAIIIGIVVYSLLKYNDFIRKQLAVYDPYRIGDLVYLKDDSSWYVIADSDSSHDTVKLVSNLFADVNQDGIISEADVIQYNKTNSVDYNESDENSIAYFLNKTLKGVYSNKIGDIKEISILTSKEFVKIRERMNFGDEWYVPNWLANVGLQNYWILSDKNNRVFVATSKGTFYLAEPNKSKFIRPTIVIKKDNVTKVEEKKNITIDLINGLKRK